MSPAAHHPGLRGRAPEAVAAGLGLAWFLALGGRAVLDPRDLSAVGAGDWAQHVLGLAYRGRMRVNSGYLARVRGAESEAAFPVWRRELSEGRVREGTLYVVEPGRRRELERLPGVVCATIDALLACVRARPGDAFAAALQAEPRAGR